MSCSNGLYYNSCRWDIGNVAVKQAAKQATKQAVKQAAKEVVKQTTKEVTKEVAKETAKEVTKEATKQVAKELTKEASKEITKTAVKQVAQTATTNVAATSTATSAATTASSSGFLGGAAAGLGITVAAQGVLSGISTLFSNGWIVKPRVIDNEETKAEEGESGDIPSDHNEDGMQEPEKNELVLPNSQDFKTYISMVKKDFTKIIGEDKMEEWFE